MKVDESFEECTNFTPTDRPSAARVVHLLAASENPSIFRDIPLSVSQSTAVECHNRLVAVGAPSPGHIANDGTNSCALLAVSIADKFLDGTDERGTMLLRCKCYVLGVLYVGARMLEEAPGVHLVI